MIKHGAPMPPAPVTDSVPLMDRATLEHELDDAWEFGRRQQLAAESALDGRKRDGWVMRKSYVTETCVRVVAKQFDGYKAGNISAEAALHEIGEALILRDDRLETIEMAEKKAAEA